MTDAEWIDTLDWARDLTRSDEPLDGRQVRDLTHTLIAEVNRLRTYVPNVWVCQVCDLGISCTREIESRAARIRHAAEIDQHRQIHVAEVARLRADLVEERAEHEMTRQVCRSLRDELGQKEIP